MDNLMFLQTQKQHQTIQIASKEVLGVTVFITLLTRVKFITCLFLDYYQQHFILSNNNLLAHAIIYIIVYRHFLSTAIAKMINYNYSQIRIHTHFLSLLFVLYVRFVRKNGTRVSCFFVSYFMLNFYGLKFPLDFVLQLFSTIYRRLRVT